MKLTQEQIDNYVANPFHCPFCDSDRIAAEDFNSETNSMDISCHKCDNQWKEVFELKTIETHG